MVFGEGRHRARVPVPGPAGRRSLRWLVVAGTALLVALALPVGWLLTRPAPQAGDTLVTVRGEASADQQPAATPRALTVGRDAAPGTAPAPVPPVSVRVPDLGIEADVVPVGVEADGSMTIPRSASQVGWYRWGPAPSDGAGNTVLAGHVDTATEGPGALFRLREVAVGAVIEVTDESGTVQAYRVRGRQRLPKDALPLEEVFAREGRPLLVVVTCGGEFVPETRRYSDNVVVTAEPVVVSGEGP